MQCFVPAQAHYRAVLRRRFCLRWTSAFKSSRSLARPAASQRKPILIDGFISTAGALIAQGLCPLAMDYVIAAHRSVEPGHAIMLDHLNKRALLDLDLRLGEGTGAALSMHIVDAAARCLAEMATFAEAGVSERIEDASEDGHGAGA